MTPPGAPARSNALKILLWLSWLHASQHQTWKAINSVTNRHYHLHVLLDCQEQTFKHVLSKLEQPYSVWSSRRLVPLLRRLVILEGYKSDVAVLCWKSGIPELLNHLENLSVSTYRVRWIFPVEADASFSQLSTLFHLAGCRAIAVTPQKAYVPQDTHRDCETGVATLEDAEKAFGPRNIKNMKVIRVIDDVKMEENGTRHTVKTEPQDTVLDCILQYSNASVDKKNAKRVDTFGNHDVDNIFTGALRAIQRKEADLGTFEIFLTHQIWTSLDFTGTVRYDSISFLSPLPQPITDLAVIARPFSWTLWLAVMISLTTYFALIYAFSSAEQRLERNKLSDLLFYLVSVLILYAPCLRVPRSSSTRILLSFWYMFSITISAVFTGCLTSFTNFPPHTAPIKTMAQLGNALERGSVRVCIKNNSYFRSVLSDSCLECRRVQHQDNPCRKNLCCLTKVLQGTHVFITNKHKIRARVMNLDERMVQAEQDFFLLHVGIVAPKLSPYSEAFRNITLRLKETGVLDRAEALAKYERLSRPTWKLPDDPTLENKRHRSLQLQDVYGLLVVWLVGMFAASSVLVCELVAGHCRKSPTSTRKRATQRPSVLERNNGHMQVCHVAVGRRAVGTRRRTTRNVVKMQEWCRYYRRSGNLSANFWLPVDMHPRQPPCTTAGNRFDRPVN